MDRWTWRLARFVIAAAVSTTLVVASVFALTLMAAAPAALAAPGIDGVTDSEESAAPVSESGRADSSTYVCHVAIDPSIVDYGDDAYVGSYQWCLDQAADSTAKHKYVVFPSGVFTFHTRAMIGEAKYYNPKNKDYSDIHTIGAGPSTELKIADGITHDMQVIVPAGLVRDVHDASFSNLRIFANGAPKGFCILGYVQVTGTLGSSNLHDTSYTNIWCHGSGKNGVYFQGLGSRASNLYVWENAVHGVASKRGSLRASNVTSVRNGGMGLDVSYDSDSTVSNFLIADSPYGGKMALGHPDWVPAGVTDQEARNRSVHVHLRLANGLFENHTVWGFSESAIFTDTAGLPVDVVEMFDHVEVRGSVLPLKLAWGRGEIGTVYSHHNVSADGLVLAQADTRAENIISSYNSGPANARGIYMSRGSAVIDSVHLVGNQAVGHAYGIWVEQGGQMSVGGGRVLNNKTYAMVAAGDSDLQLSGMRFGDDAAGTQQYLYSINPTANITFTCSDTGGQVLLPKPNVTFEPCP